MKTDNIHFDLARWVAGLPQNRDASHNEITLASQFLLIAHEHRNDPTILLFLSHPAIPCRQTETESADGEEFRRFVFSDGSSIISHERDDEKDGRRYTLIDLGVHEDWLDHEGVQWDAKSKSTWAKSESDIKGKVQFHTLWHDEWNRSNPR